MNQHDDSIEKTKQQIRGLVGEITQLSKEETTVEEYFSEFLHKVVSALAAVGGVVWLRSEEGPLELAYQINLQNVYMGDAEGQAAHGRTVGRVVQSSQPLLVPPHSGGTGEEGPANPSEFLLVLAPLETAERCEGVVEIFQRPGSDPAAQRGYLRFLMQMCELANSWLKTRQLRQFSDKEVHWDQAEQFSRLIHETLDLRETAYTIANEGRRLIQCDRVSVGVMRGNKCRIEAVSGQDKYEHRSNTVTLMGRLATRVVAAGEPLWYSGSTEDLPPQIESALHEYVDETHTKTIAVLPMRRPPPAQKASEDRAKERKYIKEHDSSDLVGALILEQIEDARPREALGPTVDIVFEHGSRALSNASEHTNLFLMPIWKAIGKAGWVLRARTLPKTLAIAGLVLLVIGLLVFFPYDFSMEGRGTLEPIERRSAFCDIDGKIVEVLVKHGQPVKKDQVLAVLYNDDLPSEIEGVVGERDQALEELRSVVWNLVHVKMTPVEKSQLAGRKGELELKIGSVNKQLALLRKKEEKLKVRSPIDGVVVTWDVKNQLLNRPVTVSQELMKIADISEDAKWELKIDMPEKKMGHVIYAKQHLEKDEKLGVSFIPATNTDEKLRGTVASIDTRAQIHGEEGHGVRIRVSFDEEQMKELKKVVPRPGATVTAKVECGKRPIGYVWLYEVWEYIQSRLLF